jgi:exodeoxyribonuclease V alpha subunit
METSPDNKNQTTSMATNGYFEGLLNHETAASSGPLRAVFRALDLSAIDWMTIDDLTALSGTKNDRSLVMVLALMFAAMREGSLCLELTGAHVNRLVSGAETNLIAGRVDLFCDRLEKNKYHHLVTGEKSNRYPLVFKNVAGTKRLYFQKYYLHEKNLHRQILAFLSIDDPGNFTRPSINTIMKDLFSDEQSLRLGKGGAPISRDPEQMAAIRKALSSPFTIISGGPGTGKTSVMVNIVRGLIRTGIPANKIALAAPTGRAAQRMTEAISRQLPTIRSLTDEDQTLWNLQGSTLHKRLRYSRHRHRFYYHEGNPLSVDVVIIDEVSMVDVVMLAKFIEALDPSRTRLILIGDKDQLPSVEAGAVFSEMIPANDRPGIFENHVVVLKNNYRSCTGINQLAIAINQGRYPAKDPVTFQVALSGETDHWEVVTPMIPERWHDCLYQWTDHYLLKPNVMADADSSNLSYPDILKEAGTKKIGDLIGTDAGRRLLSQVFEITGRSKILTLLRQGPAGCNEINAIIGQYLAAHMDAKHAPTWDAATDLFPGAVIMVTRNDYNRNLFNGDIGVVIRDTDGHFRVYFQRADEYQVFSADQLPAWESAFAVTVHKSQGSEFDDILLVLSDDATHRLLTREILYTGITRARKQVIIYGSRQAIETAVSRKISRQSGLVWGDRTSSQVDKPVCAS